MAFSNRLVQRQPQMGTNTYGQVKQYSWSSLSEDCGKFFAASSSHSLLFSGLTVCSSAPVNMKIQPLNQTALMVTWERPLTVYHPPITSYMVSYSWVKREVANEMTFTNSGDQSMVCIIIN